MSFMEKLPKEGIGKLIGIASGKGGVGKSTTTVLLASALAVQGKKVGILDADFTGPSIPRLLGMEDQRGEADGDNMLPAKNADGILFLSINMFLDKEDEPVIWRGPLLGGALTQFFKDALWGELDFLLIDFPPGTGDVLLTAFQQLPIDGLLIVATPQDFVSMIVRKSISMAVKTNTPVLGYVENMGSMLCPHCGKEYPLFSQEGQPDRPQSLPLLARFPWRKEFAQHGGLVWQKLPEDLKKSCLHLAGELIQALNLQKPAKDGPKPEL